MAIMEKNRENEAIERRIGGRIRTGYDDPRPPFANAYIVAPASANSIAKMANCTADTYVTSLMLEVIGRKIPVVVLPSLKACVAERQPFVRNVLSLREEGVTVLLGGKHGIHPTNDSSKDGLLPPFPWNLAIEATMRRLEVKNVIFYLLLVS